MLGPNSAWYPTPLRRPAESSQSGIGREGGFEGIAEYLATKYTLTPNPFS